MSAKLPDSLDFLIQRLAKLPGLGPKSALRIGMALLKWPEAETRSLGKDIFMLRDNLCLCERCGGISSESPCSICADSNRDQDLLCIVPEWDALLALEEGGFYHGQYLILGGLLAPLENRGSQNLELERLVKRLEENEINEVILALGATVEADSTASFLRQFIAQKFPGLIVSRLAQGIPLGAEVKYMDKETLRQSLKYRQNFK